MEEQRRFPRVPIKMDLEVSDIFKQDNVRVNHIDAPIEIIDVSREGIGFNSKSVLPIGYYFNARLEFEGRFNTLNCVVQIIREKKLMDGSNNYGCLFIGMPTVFDYIFKDIEDKYTHAEGEASSDSTQA
jgi:hypothetical protein